MTFRVGQKVVCVNAKRSGRRLKKNAVYVVDNVLWTDSAGELGLLIVGCPSSHPLGGWRASRFRPVVERKTDISFAHEILRKASKPARTPAFSSPHHLSASKDL